MRSVLREWTVLIAGGLLAVAGAMVATTPTQQPAAAPEVIPVSDPAPVEAVVHTPAEVAPNPAARVDELPDAVAQVLAAEGYASFVDAGELESGLPPSVVRVLVDAGAVLTVEEPARAAEASK